MECFQDCGSFKIRGIGLLCQTMVDEGKRIFVSSSGGNAGMAVAYAGKALGARVVVFVPETTPESTRSKLQEQGAEVWVRGKNWNETDRWAQSYSKETDAGYIPPFDHTLIHEGHSTIIDEILDDGIKPAGIVLTVGGGGLLTGIGSGLERLGLEQTEILAVETEGAESLSRSVAAGRIVDLEGISSIATSLGALRVSDSALRIGMSPGVLSKVVSDREALEGLLLLANHHRVLVEPACGAGLAALLNQPDWPSLNGPVVVIVCGGIGVDLSRIENWKDQLGWNSFQCY